MALHPVHRAETALAHPSPDKGAFSWTKPAHRLRVLILSALFLSLLNGCSTQPRPRIDNWDNYQAQLGKLTQWQLSGKLGVRVPPNDQHSAHSGGSAYLHWQQQPGDYAIRFSGPFGQGTTWIKGSPDGVYLEQAGQPRLRAGTPEELLFQALGWNIPISDLFYWIRGIPAPWAPIDQLQKTEFGSLARLQQSGWQLAFSHYNAVGPWQLPGKIVAERDGLRLILVIKDWRL